MRKILVALLVFGLVVAFGAPASAVDVKISGQYYVVGAFESNPSLANDAWRESLTGSGRASSAAYVGQRLRLQPEFKIAEGLTLTTRFDALEKKWGDVSWGQSGIYTYDNTNRNVDRITLNTTINGDTGIRTQENIEWERAYVDFNTAIGRFLVGYFDCICYGTLFLNTHVSRPGVEYMYPMGPWTFGAKWEHVAEGGSYGISGGARLIYSEADLDVYSVMTDYRWKTGAVGVQLQYYSNDYFDYDKGGFVQRMYTINPYVRSTFGPLFIEAEGWYGFGSWQDFRSTQQDVDLNAWAAYGNAKYTMGPWYVGALAAIETGDDPNTLDKREGSVLGAQPFMLGQAWDPFLYMFNDLIWTYNGNFGTRAGATINTFEDNCILWKAYVGWNVTPKFRVEAGYGMAWADETAAGVDDKYGSEFDLYAEYKIYDQLSYYAGFGYWWVGDYFKGAVAGAEADDSYVLLHGLKLTF